jgi:hypothetical protein
MVGGMRATIARRMLAIGLAGLVVACARTSSFPPTGAVTLADVVGTWAGRWNAAEGAGGGAVELILTGDPGAEADTVLAHLTVLEGGVSDSTRREGRLTRDGILFALVGGGTLSLTLAPGRDVLNGEFVGDRGFPAPRGSLELTRRS